MLKQNINPITFMRENIKGKSDITKCDHGDWFRRLDNACCFIEGIYIVDRVRTVLTCNMLTFMKANEVTPEFDCQNCGMVIPNDSLSEVLLCKVCNVESNWSRN